MKRIVLALAFIIGLNATALAQGYEVIREGNNKILKGFIARDQLEKDSSYTWFALNLKGYTPYADAVAALNKYKDSVQLLVFMGTWCGDSHYIIPRFYSLSDAAGFSQDQITMIGVDRQKKTISHLTDALNIKNVPTIMVMKNGKEIGRVVEYGKIGMFDKELGEIIKAAFQ